MRYALLSLVGPVTRVMGGVGAFGPDHQPVRVHESIAYQYDTDEMRSLGWRVEWLDETVTE